MIILTDPAGVNTLPAMARKKTPAPPLPDAVLELVAARFRALGDASRLKILNRLMGGERSVLELVRETGLTQTNVSRHLGVLRREGLVARQPQGNRAVYRVVDPVLVRICHLVCGSLADQRADELERLERAAG